MSTVMSSEIEKILEEYGRFEWESGAKISGGFPTLTKEQALKKLASLLTEARLDELEHLDKLWHKRTFADKVSACLIIHNRIAALNTGTEVGDE